MSKNRIYKIDLTKSQSTSLFLGTPVPCNLIYPSVFNTLNSPEAINKVKSYLSSKSIRINTINEKDVDIDNISKINKSSALNIFILDGFSPKTVLVYGQLQKSNTPSIALLSSSNKAFFEKLTNLSETLSGHEADFIKDDEAFFSNIKSISENFLDNNLNLVELDFSNFEESKEQFIELVNSGIKNNSLDNKLLEQIRNEIKSLSESSAISEFLNKAEDHENLSIKDFEAASAEYSNLDDENKALLLNINYLAISILTKRICDADENDKARFSEVLKTFTENIVNADSDIEVSIENLKNLADACLLSDDKDNSLATKASFFYIKALELLSSEDESALILDIKNNLAVSCIKLGENQKAIGLFEEIISLPANKESLIKNANINYNLGISYLNKAKESAELDIYNKAIESFSASKASFEEVAIEYDDLDIETKLSHALGKAGDISEDNTIIKSSVESYERVILMLEDKKDDERYPEALLGLSEAYLLLSKSEDKIENCIKATEHLEEALNFIDSDTQTEQYLDIKTKMGDSHLKISHEDEHKDRIKEAIKCYEDALRLVDPKEQPEYYGTLNRNLGTSYRLEGEFERNVESCHRAIDSYEQSLQFFSSDHKPEDFAEIKRNAGATFEMLSQLEFESDYCTKAIDSYTQALEIYNKDDFPETYYSTVNNLGNAYSALSEFENKEANCNKAIECYKVSSEFITYERSPIDYAMTQNNIGVAYTSLAEETDNKTYLENAINSFNESLKVYSFDEYPDNYAMIQNNLGDSYLDVAFFDGSPDLIKKAISSFEESKRVFEGESNPSKYGFIMRKIARSYKELYVYEKDPEVLQSSIRANLESLGYFKHEFFPEEYSLIQIELGGLFSNDLKDGLNVSNIYKAIEAYKNASRYFKSDVYPIQYAKISNNLGNLHRKLAFIENKKENALESVRQLSSSADYIESQSHEIDHALVLNNLGASYCVLSEVMEAEANLSKASEIFNESIELIPEDNLELLLTVKNNLSNSKCTLYEINNDKGLLDPALTDYSSAIEYFESIGANTELSICRNNYSNAKLFLSEFDGSHSNEDISTIFDNFELSLKEINSERNPGVYAAIKNNSACCNLFLFSHREKDSYINAAIVDIESSKEILNSFGTDYLESALKNNLGVAHIYNSTCSAENDECEKAIDILRSVAQMSQDDTGQVGEVVRQRASINLANAYRLFHNKVNTPESYENLINTYKESLDEFNLENYPLIYAATNYHIAMLNKENALINNEMVPYKECLSCLEESQLGFKGEKHIYENGVVDYEIGSMSLSLYQQEKDDNHLNKSAAHLESSLNIFDSEEFPNKNAHINLQLATAKFELGSTKNDLGLMFDSIENYENISGFFNEKDYPNENSEIRSKLKAAHELLLAENKSFDNTQDGVEYYNKLLGIFESKDTGMNTSGIEINLGELYLKSYEVNENNEFLNKANTAFKNALKSIDRQGEPEKYYSTLLSSADIDGKLGVTSKDADLLNNKISKIEEGLSFFNKEKDQNRYVALNSDIAETYATLYSITGEESKLFDSNHYFKQALNSIESGSQQYSDISKIYLANKQTLVDSFYENEDFGKVIDLIEKDIDFIDSEPNTEYSATSFITLGDSYQKLAQKEYNKDSLTRSIENYCMSLEYFSKENFSDKYFSIQKNIYQSSKLLFENEADTNYLNNSISTVDDLIHFCNDNNLLDEAKDYSAEKAGLLFINSENEFNSGNSKQAILLSQQSLQYYDAENYPDKYASIQKLMGRCYFENSDSENQIEDLHNSITCFNEAKNIFLNSDSSSSDEVGDINSYLEKVYEKLVEEDGHYDNEKKVEYLGSLISLYKENERYEALPSAYKDIAKTYFSLGETKNDIDLYKTSIINFKNYMSYLDEVNDFTELAAIQTMMGNISNEIYGLSEEKEPLSDAIEHYEKARELYMFNKEDEEVAVISSKLFDNYRLYGNIYENKEELETALFFYEKATQLIDEEKRDQLFYEQKLKNAGLFSTLADANNDYDTYTKAVECYRISFSSISENEKKADVAIKLGELFEKLYSINNDNSKPGKALEFYKNSLSYIPSGDQKLLNEVNDKIARLMHESAEADFTKSGKLSEDKYIDLLTHFTLEKEPAKYAEINLKLANHFKEKFQESANKADADNTINYSNASLLVYKKEDSPTQFENAELNIKSIYESLLENGPFSFKEREGYITKLKEIASNAGNSGEIAKYNLILAKSYLDEPTEALDKNDFDEFMSSLKQSAGFAENEDPKNAGELQYFIARLYNRISVESDNTEYASKALEYFDKFVNNSNIDAADPRLSEVKEIIDEAGLLEAKSYRENGELTLAIEKYKEVLQGFSEEKSQEKYFEINLNLADICFSLFEDKKDESLLIDSENHYRIAESYFTEKENSSIYSHINERMNEIFNLNFEFLKSKENVREKISTVDVLLAKYPEQDYPERNFQLQKLKGFSLVELYDSDSNAEDIYSAEKILNEVLQSVEKLGTKEDTAEINLNFAFINHSLFAINEERVKLDYALALYNSAMDFYENEKNGEKITEIKPKIDEVKEILASFDTVEPVDEEPVETEVLLASAEEEKVDEEKEIEVEAATHSTNPSELLEAKEDSESDDVLELVDEMIEESSSLKMSEDRQIEGEPSEILADNTLSEDEITEESLEAKVEEEQKEEFAPEQEAPEVVASEDEQKAPSMTKEYKARLENINKKDSPSEFIEVSRKLSESYVADAENGVNLLGYSEAIKNYKNAINEIDEKEQPSFYAEISRDLIGIYPENVREIDLREYKNMLTIAENALNYFNSKDFPEDHAAINKNIGIVNTSLAEREGQLKYYKDSIPFYDKALKIITKQSNPQDYAIINMNLGIAYGVISEIEFDNKAFMNSIKSYEHALESFDKEKSPGEYALVNKYLGIAYGTYGERNNDSGYLEKSVVCYEDSLNYFSIDDNTNDYGLINRNLGNNYLKLIETNNDPEFCKKGIKAYESALEYYSFSKTPFVYASIYNNIGSIYSALSDLEDKVENCEKAIDSYSKVLKVYDINDNPMEFAAANNNLGIVHRNLAEVNNKAVNSTKAISFYEKSLKAYSLKDFPIQYSNTQNNLGTAYRTLAEEENKIDNCKKAISSYKRALKVRTIENMPIQFAATQNNLGVAYRTLSEVESKSNNCKNAISSYESALIVYSFEKFPIQYATTRNNLAGAYSTLAESEDKKQNYSNSIKSYREAQKVFSQNQFPDIYNMIEENIVYLQNNVD